MNGGFGRGSSAAAHPCRQRIARFGARTGAVLVIAIAAACASRAPAPSNAYRGWPEARAAVCSLTTRTLARPAPAKRLFVEGYFVRSLIAASEVLRLAPQSPRDSALARAGLGRAIAWADTLCDKQAENGFWPIGYASGWVADMAAAAAVFRVLEPSVDASRQRRYAEAGEKFVRGLERDGFLLASGAVGLGWPMGERAENVVRAWRSDIGWSDSTYLVSTSLAGISLQAWLWRRTGKVEYQERAQRAFDVTLASLRPDGTFPTRGKQEGPYGVGAYVEEGWMAADAIGVLDAERQARFRPALVRHVDWLLRTQREDGTWSSEVKSDASRAAAIVDFLVWYETRMGREPKVRDAIERASAALARAVVKDVAVSPADDDHEVWRAHAGRSLAAVVTGQPVP